jgi:hypothetical protein
LLQRNKEGDNNVVAVTFFLFFVVAPKVIATTLPSTSSFSFVVA